MPTLILASQSPRRIELIARLVPDFRAATSDVEDRGSDLWPEWELPPVDLPPGFPMPSEAHPTLWAWRKAVDVAQHTADEGEIVLGADTVVIGPDALLGKPKGREDAIWMLRMLRGTRHFVATGHAVVQRKGDSAATLHAGVAVSAVWLHDYSDDELTGYVATGEPLDKAGAYAIQGLGGKLVANVEGCYYTVVGLPLCDVRRALVAAGVEALPYPKGGYCANCSFLSGDSSSSSA
jgi:septum formation protein